jgi:hypothetical protein
MIEMSHLSDDLYRIETATPFMEDIISYGDTIDAATGIDGTLIFRRVAKKSDYAAYSYVVTEKIAQCVELKAILEKVKELGGHCEIVFSGCVYIFIPKEARYDPAEDIQKLFKQS